MPEYFLNAIANTWAQLQIVAVIYCVGLAIEAARPAQPNQPLGHIGFNIAWTALFLLVTNLAVPSLQGFTKPLTDGYSIGVPVAFPDGIAGQVAQGIAFLFIYDFFYYWFHRSQHVLPFLWAQHKIHHSELSLNVTTGNRHHWLEEPLRVFTVLLPIGLLFNQKPITIVWLWIGLTLWGYFIHMNLRLHLGPLTPVLGGPQLHRIHHSRLPEHQDRNFAAFFPMWDLLFGTYFKPKADEYPPTGLHSGEELNGLWRASYAPFQTWLTRRPRVPAAQQPDPSQP